MKSIKRILVPTDYSPTSGVALEAALSLASKFGAAVEVLHAWSGVGYVDAAIPKDVYDLIAKEAKDEMDKFISGIHAPDNVEITSRVQHGIPWEIASQLSSEFDLIVMGTHGRTGFQRLMLGSVASRVCQHAKCPVMTIREQSADEQAELAKSEEIVVHAMFDDAAHITKSFDLLQEAGVSTDDISLVMTEDTHDKDFKELDKTKAVQGATAGGIMGQAPSAASSAASSAWAPS